MNNNIIIPFPNNQNFKLYIENEIDGFIIGIEGYSENFNYFVKEKSLKRYIQYIKNIDKKVYIMLNKVYFNNEIDNLKTLLFDIDKLDVDAVFFSDMAIFNIVKENNLNIKLIWNSKMTTNSKTINFLSKRGLNGFAITPQITIDEYIDIVNNTQIESFIKLFGYTNMATSSRSLITNYFKYINLKKSSNKKYYMYDKITEEYYPIIESKNTNFFSSKVMNGILEYKKLLNKNIKFSVILDDFMIPENSFYNVIETFVALRSHPNDDEFADKLKKVIESNISKNTDNGFLNKKTIFKVKNNE